MISMFQQGGFVLVLLLLMSLFLFYLVFNLQSLQFQKVVPKKDVQDNFRWMKLIITIAPLMGLLGTVNGMIKLFEGLSSSSSSLNQIGLMSSGISQALLTTQCGLLITVPGLLVMYYLNQKFKKGDFVYE